LTVVGADPLDAIVDVARQLGADDIVRDAGATSAQISGNLFYVACLGQFKRGKSTLLNALLGEPILPTGVVPVTALITIVRFGTVSRAVVTFADGGMREIAIAELPDFVSEERNPANANAVTVEVYVNSPLLVSGMCLVDTPGLGSVFEQSTAQTHRFLPHIDAALLVVGADPPISAEEAALLKKIARDLDAIIVVLNKSDRLADTEVRQAVIFTRRILNRDVLVVSAAERLQGLVTRDWPRLQDALSSLSHESGAQIVAAARCRALRRFIEALQREIVERRDALRRPIDETEQRLQKMQVGLAQAERALADLSPLFRGEHQRLAHRFAAQREQFLEQTIAEACSELLLDVDDMPESDLRNQLLVTARRIAEQRIRRWLSDIEPKSEQAYAMANARFARLVRDFAEQAGSSIIDLDFGFRVRRRFYFTGLLELTTRSPFALAWPWRRRQSVIGEARRYLIRLLETNSARVINDLIDRALGSHRQLESEVGSYLRGIVAAIDRAAEEARRAHIAGKHALVSQIADLDEIEANLTSLARPQPVARSRPAPAR
jgi:hypothetical protein